MNYCEEHQVIDTPHCPICLMAEVELLRGRLSDLAEVENALGILIIRKQAEAIESLGKKLTKVPGVTEHCNREAQSLRKQTKELEENLQWILNDS